MENQEGNRIITIIISLRDIGYGVDEIGLRLSNGRLWY
jgi:hypothetical protein